MEQIILPYIKCG